MSRGLKSVALFVAFVAIYVLSRHAIGTTTTTTTSTVASTTTVATSTTLAVAQCVGSEFTGVFNQGQGAAGTVTDSVTLTKTGAGTCAVKGWPILTLQDRTGAVLPLSLVQVPSSSPTITFATAKANQPPTLLTMAHGSSTTFALAYNDVPVGTTACDNATTLSVQFPGGGSTVTVTPAYAVQPCNGGRVWVSPFF